MPFSRSPGCGIRGRMHRVFHTFGMIRRGTLSLIFVMLSDNGRTMPVPCFMTGRYGDVDPVRTLMPGPT